MIINSSFKTSDDQNFAIERRASGSNRRVSNATGENVSDPPKRRIGISSVQPQQSQPNFINSGEFTISQNTSSGGRANLTNSQNISRQLDSSKW